MGKVLERANQIDELQWFHLAPLSIRDDEPALVHSNLLFWKVEAEFSQIVNPESQQTLERLPIPLSNRPEPLLVIANEIFQA